MSKTPPTPRDKQTSPYWKALNKIIDPELGIGLVDLGLVYQINVDKKGFAHIVMTFTNPGCPYGPMLLQQVEDSMRFQEEIKDVQVEIVWDPVWNQEMIDSDIRDLMFGF